MNAFRLALVTWNVGGAQPGIVPGTSSLLRCARDADVVVVGLQEVAVASRGWKTELIKALGSGWVYVAGESYAGLRLKAFSRVRDGLPVVDASSSSMRVGVGFGDRWPNKGAVAVEMRFGNTCRVVFVVAHLAANEDQVQGRADDWRAILRRLDRDQFLSRSTDPSSLVVPLFHQYDHVFVLGDLNYRVVPPGEMPERRVRWVHERILRKEWHTLVAADQLNKQRLDGKVFANFEEAVISFPPTFKIDPKTGNYSANRVPSYCDRILWHSLPSFIDHVKCLQYRPLPKFMQSDHLPLFGEYQLQVPVIVRCPRPFRSSKGIRIVLEFTLVRFIKGASAMVKRESSEDRVTSMRRIPPPESLRLPFSQTSMRPPTLEKLQSWQRLLEQIPDGDTEAEMGTILPPEEDGDEDETDEDGMDDEEEMEEDDEDEESSPSSSSDEDEPVMYTNNNPCTPNSESDCVVYEQAEITCAPFRHDEMTGRRRVQSTRPCGNEYNTDMLKEASQRRVGLSSPLTSNSAPPTFGHSSKRASMPAGRSDMTTPPQTRATQTASASACGTNSGPRKRDSLSRQAHRNKKNQKAKKRSRLNVMRMEVHGQGLFLKRGRIYRIGIPKRKNGVRERIGESLPVIPLAPLNRLEDLDLRHLLLEFAKKKSRVGTSGVLPLRALLPYMGSAYAFELFLTKYGSPVGTVEACVQLTISDCGHWVDSQGRVVRLFDGSSPKNYRGPLPVRKRTSARSKPGNGKWR